MFHEPTEPKGARRPSCTPVGTDYLESAGCASVQDCCARLASGAGIVDHPLLNSLKDRILVIDGAMGTSIHAHDLSLEADFRGFENCSEILNESRPDVIESIHNSFLAVGVDCIETNTFGANRIVLGEFGLEDQTYVLNKVGAEIARRCADGFATRERPRFVLGSIGPGTKLPSLGHTTFDVLEDGYAEQARGLLDGGVDAFIIETCQDLLQAKAAICGASRAMDEKARHVPIIAQVTIEATGAMLVGTEIGAALVALQAYPQVQVIGINCATGPLEMSEHVRLLGHQCTRYISVVPNAGLPQVVDGKTCYVLTPAELARWHKEFVLVDGVNMVGGCCGTTPDHLAAVVEAVRDLKPTQRRPYSPPSVASLYQPVALRQDKSFLIVGERSNTNGSRRFKRLLEEGDIDAVVEVGREQVREGAHLIDVCVDHVGREGVTDMDRVVARYAKDITVPLMLDSTEPDVIETGLKRAGGKCIINSVSLEDGEAKLEAICPLLRKYGAAVVALTIDEDPAEAMAKTADRKIGIARRLHGLLTRKHGIPEEDVLFDCLTFPITTGNDSDRRLALETIEGVRRIMDEFPRCGTILGVSNVSFGLAPAARAVLNSVFLHEARKRGLTAAIVHTGKILPETKISEERWRAALDLIYDHRPTSGGLQPARPAHTDKGHEVQPVGPCEASDPLHAFIGLFAEGEAVGGKKDVAELPIEERLRHRIVDGRRVGLEEDLDEAMARYSPLDIINVFLLDGMKVVGDLFGAGKMQLPFVLSSAETMKAAVRYLERHMERVEGNGKGTIILATVRGDVHDIGKNLVDIILSNNGYTVHNLGIKQPISNVIDAYKKHGADAIGLSGLLVKSTLVMRDDLRVLNEVGLKGPVILGGAALTRGFVEHELRALYHGEVTYAKDAFEGLALMDRLAEGKSIVDMPRQVVSSLDAQTGQEKPAVDIPERSEVTTRNPIPTPPFWGPRIIERIDLSSVLRFVNEVMLFQVHWQYKKQGRSPQEFREYISREVRPIYNELIERCRREDIFKLQSVYGYWPCNSEGDDLIIYRPPEPGQNPTRDELQRFTFPRQGHPPFWCLSDFWRPYESGEFDVAAFSLVTVGRRVSQIAREYFKQDLYQDYLYLHGLSVEVAEAMTEHLHKQIRMELGIAGSDARDMRRLLQQGYQGSRYSFGFPACPNLEDQAKLFELLQPGRIGVSLSDEYQIEPEQSTSAIVTHHPEARYFNVRSAAPDEVRHPMGVGQSA
ncbi:MAG: methionine synthase [Phycisphaerae bacterium]|nr:methionine synthase [Phycisphaerae bacterium]